jgi:carboxyl-terminal processing protease
MIALSACLKRSSRRMGTMSEKSKTLIIILLVAAVIAASFSTGWVLGTRNSPPQEPGIVEEVWDIIFQDYVDKDGLDAGALAQGAVRGMVEALDDPYTAYLDATAYELSQKNLEGKFEGIGAYVTADEDGQVVIIAPVAGSPADEAGIKAGDVILAVDGRPAAEMSLVEVVLNVQGPKGTPVTLSVLHQGETEPVVLEIIRAEVELPSVYFEMREDIAYINITNFSERTAIELYPVLVEADQRASGIIIDLRSNPGGLLTTVVSVTSFFLDEGVVIDVVDNEGNHFPYSVEPGKMVTDLPIVVLVDEYSASGSEVLAGALQDYGRAVIAGKQTYGKGSANSLYPLGDGSALYITSARWFTPNGRLIEGEGLSPDYELDLENIDAVQWAIDYLRGK